MSVEQSLRESNRVVVGVDGSKPSQEALRWARFMAEATGSTLEAVMVWQPVSAYNWGTMGWAAVPSDWNPAEEALRVLTSAVDEVFGPTKPEGLVLTVREGGGAAPALIDISNGAQTLVVGSRGHGGFAGLLLGSVSTACAEHASCPVLVIHGVTSPPSRPARPSDADE
ncbi:MAG TPA: universal stress protein [Jatrophihabitans sp.]|jgi:nucleotide-binding universal stress UspA family protein|uniref:universal stress protein n=1 Tax=Jatrophihabitans sp. TaxID=1932789 RepID=UPI002F0600D5